MDDLLKRTVVRFVLWCFMFLGEVISVCRGIYWWCSGLNVI